jgi:hypothetical protein
MSDTIIQTLLSPPVILSLLLMVLLIIEAKLPLRKRTGPFLHRLAVNGILSATVERWGGIFSPPPGGWRSRAVPPGDRDSHVLAE